MERKKDREARLEELRALHHKIKGEKVHAPIESEVMEEKELTLEVTEAVCVEDNEQKGNSYIAPKVVL